MTATANLLRQDADSSLKGGNFFVAGGRRVCALCCLRYKYETLKINGKKSKNVPFLKNVASCVQTRFILYMLGFSLITMHLGDKSHCTVGFRAAVSSYGA